MTFKNLSKNPLLVLMVIVILLIVLVSAYVMHNGKRVQENLSPVFEQPKYGLSCEIDRKCTPENNCFPGSYMRSQVYQNMCEPDDSRITREPVKVKDNCLRTLDDKSCHINNRNQRRCEY